LVLLLEGHLVNDKGEPVLENSPSIINEAAFFGDNKKYEENILCGSESKYSFIEYTDIKKILGADLPSIIKINKKN